MQEVSRLTVPVILSTDPWLLIGRTLHLSQKLGPKPESLIFADAFKNRLQCKHISFVIRQTKSVLFYR